MVEKYKFKGSLHRKILVYLGVSVLLVLMIIIWLFGQSMYKTMLSDRLYTMHIDVKAVADELRDINKAASSAVQFASFAQENGFFEQRENSILYLKEVLHVNPQIESIYLIYEKNEEKDLEFILEHPDLKASILEDNRFAPKLSRSDDGKIELAATSNLEELQYDAIKESPNYEKVIVTDPIKDEERKFVRLLCPIVINGEFVGLAGIDYSLSKIALILGQSKPFKSTEFILCNEDGYIIDDTLFGGEEKFEFFSQLATSTDWKKQIFRERIEGENYAFAYAPVALGTWTLVMRVFEQELLVPIRRVLLRAILFALFGAVFIFLVLGRIVRSITNPVKVAAVTAKKVSSGDLTAEVKVTSDDEMGALLDTFRIMTNRLRSLIGQVKGAASQVMNTAEEIGETTRHQEENVKAFGKSSQEVDIIAKEISVTSNDLVKEVGNVSNVVKETTDLASAGNEALVMMEQAMRKLSERTGAMTAKFSGLVEKANNISSVVTTISNVADYTDLLSLNASIEAAKAGEMGAGFGSVAKEVRRLADQTAEATEDIGKMVREMQTAVITEVKNMDNFSKEVSSVVEEVGKIKMQLSQIIEQVQTLRPYFKGVDEGMQSQLKGARAINESMLQLQTVTQTSEKSLQELQQATEHLNGAASSLEQEVSNFKL